MIRKIQTSDRQSYIELATQFYNSDAVLHPIDQINIEKTFDEMLRSDCYAEGFVFEYESMPIGYALLAKTFSQEAGGMVIWIEELYVLPQYRSKGIASRFFAFLEEHYPAKRYRLEIEPENQRAAELYKRMGFKVLPYRQMIKDI